MADARRRILLGAVRKDHEFGFLALGGISAQPRQGLYIQSRISADRWPRYAARQSALLHVVRLDGRRLGRAQRQGRLGGVRAGVRRPARHPAVRGSGTVVASVDDWTRADRGLRWSRQIPWRHG